MPLPKKLGARNYHAQPIHQDLPLVWRGYGSGKYGGLWNWRSNSTKLPAAKI